MKGEPINQHKRNTRKRSCYQGLCSNVEIKDCFHCWLRKYIYQTKSKSQMQSWIGMSNKWWYPDIKLVVNTLRPRPHRRRFADDIFKCIFFNENCCILNKIPLKFVRKGPIDNNPALVQILAWRRLGDKTFSEPMMVSLPTHICVIWPHELSVVSSP